MKKSSKSVLHAVRYGANRQKWLIVGMLVIIAVGCVFVRPWNGEDANAEWYKGWDVVFSLSTLAVAVLVWLAEMRQEWENSLPKKLNALFYLGDRLVMCCRNAPLASEGDIRAWAQQLGAQMANEKFLGLHPRFTINNRIESTIAGTFRLYEIRMTLSEMPARIDELLAPHGDSTKHFVMMDPQSGKLTPEAVAEEVA